METAALIMTKVTVPFTITLLVLGLIIAIWLGYIACLTIKENRACQGSQIEDQVYKLSPKYAELQGVINEYSVQKGGIGLQVTVIFRMTSPGPVPPGMRISSSSAQWYPGITSTLGA